MQSTPSNPLISEDNHLSVAAWAWIGAGLVLRLARAPLRWDEPVFDYAYYYSPVVDALATGHPWEAATSFIGLHPPLYAILFATLDRVSPTPALWLLFSAVLSSAAVLMTARAAMIFHGRTAATSSAAWMAVAPVQVAYAAEVNNYPLLAASGAALLWAAAAAQRDRGCLTRKGRQEATRPGRRRAVLLGVIAAAAAWSHVLGAVAAATVLLFARVPRKTRLIAISIASVLCLPLAVGALEVMREGTTFNQPGLAIAERLELLWLRFGHEGVVTCGWALTALVLGETGRSRVARAVMLTSALAIATFLAVGIAAPHQFSYLVALGPSAAVIAGSLTGRSRRVRLLLHTFAAMAAIFGISRSIDLGREILEDLERPRAIDRALEASRPGDVIWLVTPFQPDDDKRLFSPVLWRLKPWEQMPAVRTCGFDPLNFRYGTPRAWRGRTVHLFTRVFPGQMGELLECHARTGAAVWVVLYDSAREPPLEAHLDALMAAHSAGRMEIFLGEGGGRATSDGRDVLYNILAPQ